MTFNINVFGQPLPFSQPHGPSAHPATKPQSYWPLRQTVKPHVLRGMSRQGKTGYCWWFRNPVKSRWGRVVEIPLFYRGFIHFQVVGNGISEPSSVWDYSNVSSHIPKFFFQETQSRASNASPDLLTHQGLSCSLKSLNLPKMGICSQTTTKKTGKRVTNQHFPYILINP